MIKKKNTNTSMVEFENLLDVLKNLSKRMSSKNFKRTLMNLKIYFLLVMVDVTLLRLTQHLMCVD